MPEGSSNRQAPGQRTLRGWLPATVLAAFLGPGRADAAQVQLATTPADFVQPGTQPSPRLDNFERGSLCRDCHGRYLAGDEEPYDSWAASMMAQSARDPVWRAAVTVANRDAAGIGETCIRCHAPVGWLATRSTGGDPAALQRDDFDGVNCHFCHRMLNPISGTDSAAGDAAILAALGLRPAGTCAAPAGQPCVADADCAVPTTCLVDAGQGRFVVDPDDSRRGPFRIGFAGHETVFSGFHHAPDACAPCHDVSTPTYTRAGDAYVLNALDAPHPTQRPADMFPEQRTYTEWRLSDFARGGVVFPDGRFGGNLTARRPNAVPVSTCQDCHMPDAQAAGCDVTPERPDMPAHFFAGANTWVLGAVLDQFGAESGLTEAAVGRAHERVARMLGDAADLELTQTGRTLTVRVVNQTGHKLPTGYPEGRRMWLTVRFFDDVSPTPLVEDGAYDLATARLDRARTTKIYEVRHEIDEHAAEATGLPAGTPFHLALSNRVAFDNRIPPRGFLHTAFAAAGAAPVGQRFADGQYWDDTPYAIPDAATRVEVTLSYQTSSQEYVEFLRDTAMDGSGENVWQRWLARGRSAPVEMDRETLVLEARCPAGSTGTPCADDGDPCTDDRCAASGACEHTPVTCPDDGNPCTDDVCNATTGTCGAPRDGTCDDRNACTTSDVCTAGVCRGAAVSCDDADACTEDGCDPDAGCRHQPLGFAGVRAMLLGGLVVEPCAGEEVPARLTRLFARAERLVERAENARKPGAAREKLRQARATLKDGERSAKRSRLPAGCATSLAARFAAVRAATACLHPGR